MARGSRITHGQGGMQPPQWAYFSFFLAVLNELIWRTQSTDVWVNFKVFGVLILTFLFTILQVITLEKYITDKTK